FDGDRPAYEHNLLPVSDTAHQLRASSCHWARRSSRAIFNVRQFLDMKTRLESSSPATPGFTSVASGHSKAMVGGLRSAWLARFALVVWLGAGLTKGAAQGIPEPSLVMYGVVRNTQDIDRLRIVFGNLTWTFQPVGGGPSFAVSAALTNIND